VFVLLALCLGRSLVFLVPLGVLSLAAGVPFVALLLKNRLDMSDDSSQRTRHKLERRKIIKLIVFALFLSKLSGMAGSFLCLSCSL
jgi:hypothetical protein